MNTVEEEQTLITNKNKNHENCIKINRMMDEIDECETIGEKENRFIEILEYIYQSNFCENNKKFGKVFYEKIIEFYHDTALSNEFKQYLEHYANNIFIINICNIKLSNNPN
jgi:hypothetical protein